ncbi:MAG: MCP four helix bundle domain-containing protein [Burkholderiales bacterium]|nr:MCP four helix bundle domain-containing protein [Burkholderiales bacterium]
MSPNSGPKPNLRLLAGILLGALLLALIGAAGLVSMSKVQRRLEVVIRIHNAESRQAREMHSATFEMSRLIRDLVLVTDEAGMRRVYASFRLAQANYRQHEARLAAMFADPTVPASAEERALFRQIKTIGDLAAPQLVRVAELGLKNNNAEATRVLMEDAQPKIAAWMRALGELVDLEDQINDESTADAASAYATARTMIIGLGGLALLLGAGLAWWVSRPAGIGDPVEAGEIRLSKDAAGIAETTERS